MMPDHPHILVVEDEPNIRRFVRTALESEACEVLEASHCQQALKLLKQQRFDLLLLDLGLPDGDGLNLISKLRTWSKLPILVLSARIAEQDKIKALDLGADDYLSKPFLIGELLARVRALLRRSQPQVSPESHSYRFGQIEVDLQQRRVTRAGEIIHLTPIEFRLLAVLLTAVEGKQPAEILASEPLVLFDELGLRGQLSASRSQGLSALSEAVLAAAREAVAAALEGKTVKKEVYVPGRLVNIVAV